MSERATFDGGGSSHDDVRLHVYRRFVQTGAPPSVQDAAIYLGLPPLHVDDAYRSLAGERAIVLHPGTTEIWMAGPLSALPTPFRVETGRGTYHGNCIWGALGISAMLHEEARILTTCGDCRGPLALRTNGEELAPTDCVVHFGVPVARWWDDIGHTCSTMLLFRSDEHVRRWREARGAEGGATLSPELAWELARAWYGEALLGGWRRPTGERAGSTFAGLGLTDPFWRPAP